jgi:hypothetical protein
MEHEEKINYMRIAANIANFGFNNEHLDKLVCLYEMVLDKAEGGSIRDVVKIEIECKNRADVKRRSEMLDKVSKKV